MQPAGVSLIPHETCPCKFTKLCARFDADMRLLECGSRTLREGSVVALLLERCYTILL